MSWLDSAQWVGGGLFMLAATWLTGRFTARTSAHATETGAAVQKEANAIEGFRSLATEHRAEIARLSDEMGQLRDAMRGLQAEVQMLQQERRKERNKIRQLVAWAIVMRDALLDARLPVPVPPGGADADDLLDAP